MSAPRAKAKARHPDPLARLRHDLKSPLTIISGRAQLLARAIQRSPSLAEGDREKLLSSLTEIEVAVQRLVIVIDGLEPQRSARHHDAPRPST
jgi:signal transduction histidine kinase